MIPEQSFDISLNDWGNVTFVSCKPMPDSEGAIPCIEVRVYEDNGNEFVYNESLCNELRDLPYDITPVDVKVLLNQEDKLESNGEWEDAYKKIIRNMDSYLSDPYIVRRSSESDVDSVIGHIGIHDFNNDNIPELIIGDLVSMGVFTFEDGIAKKIADLYEPEDWCYISGVYYKDNTIVLVNCGSDGGCYVCFTYDEGESLWLGERL